MRRLFGLGLTVLATGIGLATCGAPSVSAHETNGNNGNCKDVGHDNGKGPNQHDRDVDCDSVPTYERHDKDGSLKVTAVCDTTTGLYNVTITVKNVSGESKPEKGSVSATVTPPGIHLGPVAITVAKGASYVTSGPVPDERTLKVTASLGEFHDTDTVKLGDCDKVIPPTPPASPSATPTPSPSGSPSASPSSSGSPSPSASPTPVSTATPTPLPTLPPVTTSTTTVTAKAPVSTIKTTTTSTSTTSAASVPAPVSTVPNTGADLGGPGLLAGFLGLSGAGLIGLAFRRRRS